MCYKWPYLPSVQYVNPFCAGFKYSQLNYIKVISKNGQAPDINHAIIRHGLDLGAQVHLSSWKSMSMYNLPVSCNIL